jgi:hypothetical protein
MRLRDDYGRGDLTDKVRDILELLDEDAHAADIESALRSAALDAGTIARYEAMDS